MATTFFYNSIGNGDNIPLFLGSTITVHGTVSNISGTGPSATVSIITLKGDVLVVLASDVSAPQDQGGPAVSSAGKTFNSGAQVTVSVAVSGFSVGASPSYVVTITGTANSGRSVSFTGSATTDSGTIQTSTVSHTMTTAEINAGLAQVTVSFPVPYADANYTVVCSLNDSGVTTGTDYYIGNIRNKTASGFTGQIFCYSPSVGTAGDVETINYLAIHY